MSRRGPQADHSFGSSTPFPEGTAVPELRGGFAISKRYDIVYTGDYGSAFVERLSGVRIVGYVGGEDDESVSKMYMRGRWLAVEYPDGRRAYLMPHAIHSLRGRPRTTARPDRPTKMMNYDTN